jgi:hypothetical protein
MVMTFKELALQDERTLAAPLRAQEAEATMLQAVMDNQSPVMKLWFAIMIVNLALFLLLLH